MVKRVVFIIKQETRKGVDKVVKKAVEISDLTKLISVTDPQISPDGKRVVFVHTQIDEKENTYIAHLYHIDLETGQQSQWTNCSGRVHSPRWSTDGTAVAFLLEQGREKQLFVLSIADEKTNILTGFENGVDRFEWSPCGTKIWINASVEKEEPKSQRYRQIGLVDIESKSVEFVTQGNFNHSLEAISHDGEKMVFGLAGNLGKILQQPLYLYDTKTKQQTMLTEELGYFNGAAFSHDDSKLAYTGSMRYYGDATHTELYIADLLTNTRFCLTEGMDAPIGDYAISDYKSAAAPAVVWTKDDHLYFQVSTMGDVRLYFASLDGMIFPASPDMEHVYGYDVSRDGVYAVLASSNPIQPGELHRLTITTGEYQTLTSFNQKFLEATELVQAQPTITTGSMDVVHGWLIKPASCEEGQNYPLIVKVHDNPLEMFANTFFQELQFYAASGFGIFYANPSGSHGYSQEFATARRDFTYEDLLSAITDTVEAADWIDASRIAVLGEEVAEQVILKLKSMNIATTFVRFPDLSRTDTPNHRIARLEQIVNWLADNV